MISLQAFASESKLDEYRRKIGKVNKVSEIEQWYGSLTMDVIILGLAIYFLVRKRWQRFEMTILVCMFFKHFSNAVFLLDAV